MEKKKTKLTLSGIAKKSIQNIEIAKTQSKNSVIIEKKNNRFANRTSFNRNSNKKNIDTKNSTFSPRPPNTSKPSAPITNDYERRKLAEQRATRRLRGDTQKDSKGKASSKKKRIEINSFKSFK